MMHSHETTSTTVENETGVLILVVMDDALALAKCENNKFWEGKVLILVVMDDAPAL